MKKILYVILCCLFMTAALQGVAEMRSPLPVLPSI